MIPKLENPVMELKSLKRIQFTDCDSFGHLNNAAYLNYFMNTREEQVLENYQLSFAGIYQQYNKAWVVSETRIAYLTPTKYAQNVSITTRIVQVRKSSVIIEGIMTDEKDNLIHAISSINFAWVDIESGKPKLHPEEILSFLNSINTNLAATGLDYFNDRIKTLRKLFK